MNNSPAHIEDTDELYPDVIAGVKKLYRRKIRPVEELYKFDEFYSPLLRDSDFEAKPMVLLMGQYSVGKTSFIRYLVGQDFPGSRIGPEPTTDRFTAIMYNEEDMVIPGNALSIQKDAPFHALQKFGTSFLSKFEASQCSAPILQKVTFIDTPGVLSGEKQRHGRTYDFIGVSEWFAERADMILLLFDAHKLDISDEFRSVIEQLKGHDDKVRVVLNKSDSITSQQLMRVYGALMWSLGKVLKTPEVVRVYIGSFWDKPYQNGSNAELFDAEKRDLLADLEGLPRNNAVRKVNELVKRARLAKVHAYIIGALRAEMPAMFYKESKQKELIDGLLGVFQQIQRQYMIPPGDFPNVERFKQRLQVGYDFSKFPKLNPKMISQMDAVLAEDIPKFMKRISPVAEEVDLNPFNEPEDSGWDWDISPSQKAHFDESFFALGPINGQLSGQTMKAVLSETGLTVDKLKVLWRLADINKDGKLDNEEFAVAVWLADRCKADTTYQLPNELPTSLVPPGKRSLITP